MKLRWTRHARRDLLAIAEYISRDNIGAAERWTSLLIERGARASEFPFAGRVVPEISRPDVREVMHGNYRIVYRVCSSEVQVLTIQESHRTLKSVD